MKIISRFCFFSFLMFASTQIFAKTACYSLEADWCPYQKDEKSCSAVYQESDGQSFECYTNTADNEKKCTDIEGVWEEEYDPQSGDYDYVCKCPYLDNVRCKWYKGTCYALGDQCSP